MTESKKNEISSQSVVFRKVDFFLQEESDNWGLAYDSEMDRSFSVNPLSIFILKQIEYEIAVHEIIEKIKEHFINVPDEVEKDVIEFLTNLYNNGYITIENS